MSLREIYPGNWCAKCTLKYEFITIVGGMRVTRIEPCMSIVEKYNRTGQTDSRCKASLQAALNKQQGIG